MHTNHRRTPWSAAAGTALLLAAAAQAEVITVDSTDDLPDANLLDGVCDADLVTAGEQHTLRAAVMHANVTPGADEIVLPAGKYKLKIKGVLDSDGSTGDLDVTDDLKITGAGVLTTVIDGKKAKDRVFDIAAGADVEISDVTIRGGKVGRGESGGGVRNVGAIFLHDLLIFACVASDDGGGFDMTQGSAVMQRVVFNRCKTKDDGGGLDMDAGTCFLEAGAVVSCKAGSEGGGIEYSGPGLTLINCTISSNKARDDAGGISLEDGGTMSLLHCTIARNKAKKAGGISVTDEEFGANTCTTENSIFSKNAKGNADRALSSEGGNVDSGITCGFTRGDDLSNSDPKLKPLGTYGGNTLTHPIDGDSSAEGFVTDNCASFDQRGTLRSALACDSGAFEFGGGLPLKR